MLKQIDKIIVSDQAPKNSNVLWLQPSESGYQIKLNLGSGYININKSSNDEHEYIDLGLPSGTLWATCNIGASKPEEYGNYYAWGELFPKKRYTDETSLTVGKEITEITGNAQYDAARVIWGGNWRIPTQLECQELIDNCTWTLTTQNGVNGYKVEGPNGNSIFLPTAGLIFGSAFTGVGTQGNYWSSAPWDKDNDNDNAYNLFFSSSSLLVGNCNRTYGLSVRPVKSK